MTLSLGLVIVFVFVTVAFLGGSLGILRQEPLARDVRPVDFTEEVRTAVVEADYEVLAPSDVPTDWVPQSARTAAPDAAGQGSVLLQVGFLTPQERYATVVQSDAEPAAVVEAQRLGEQPEGTVDVEGRPWQQHRRVDRDEHALVRTDGQRTVVVTGDAPLDDLRVLAAGLEPADAAAPPPAGDGFAPIG
jgi:hypothetical protein